MTLPRLLFVLALATAASACSGPLVTDAPDTQTAVGYPNHSADQIRQEMRRSLGPIQTVSSDGKVRIASAQLNQDASFSLRARLGDSLTVVVRGPFGIEGGRALATPDSFLAADKINKRLYLGPAAAAERYVPGAGSSERVARAATGLLVPGSGVDWQLTHAGGRYSLDGILDGGARRRYTIDPAVWRVTRVLEIAPDGTISGEQTFGAFDTVQGVVVPRRVTIESGGNRIELEHRSVTLNGAVRQLWRRPSGYDERPIR